MDNHSSRRTIACTFKQPTRILSGQLIGYLFGFATRGVYLAMTVASHAVSSYLTVSPLPNHSTEYF